MPIPEVIHNPEQHRFEINLDGTLALLEYKRRDPQILFTHTEVPPAAEGKGIGSRMTKAALDYAREQQLEIVPLCEFVVAYIRRHPEYVPLVSSTHRGKVER